ncbi:hypothetical protein HT665_07410 [Ursidibacter maritimus]|uniref:Leucine-rich repeat domain-containing protein n=1 Tax=Ursidibacter maritimus TaxID=1331689 RepID=A0A949T889_9PAST|nr:hypothetical protein [Ursidibacter maritimus]KAE9538409.1 hypothetical protein A1D26_06055 [Ursidibacter maritimus]MBV6523456.1 hypothetical protein [Ursidibacter maritimus]MBV6525859.1 hypothetical protein [Ursidibacter maritimus]MBV6528199.1 hypothetical protein [Ursidibacter maritimus]MBV6529330.1 hypothetical protein [Ursidibacter maritimus]
MSKIKKSASYENFVIEQGNDNKISITLKNTKQALREIADKLGMEYESDWNTQSLGSKLINHINGVSRNVQMEGAEGVKKSAKYGNFVIEQAENNSISITCDNTKEGLRQISGEIGMVYESDWNTQYLGNKVINFINEGDTTRKVKSSNKDIAKKEFDENNLISDEDWNWWVSLSDSLKYMLLKSNGEWRFEDEFEEDFPTLVDDEITCEIDLNDRSIMGNFVATNFTGYYDEEGNLDHSDILISVSFPDEVFDYSGIEKLTHLKFLEGISFSYVNIESIPECVGKLTTITDFDFSRNEITADTLGELSSLANNLQVLNLSSNLLAGTAEDYEPLTKLSQLNTLDLSSNNIGENAKGFLEKIAQIESLEDLDLSFNALDGHDFSPLSRLPELLELNLRYCVTITDDLLKALSSCTELRKLDLSGNEVAVVKRDLDLSQFTSLKELVLEGKSISVELLSAIVTIPNLEKLTIDGCGYYREKIRSDFEETKWSKLTHLKELTLEYADISVNSLAEIAKISSLETLKLNGSDGIKGSNAIEQFDCEALVNLRSLDLSDRPVSAAALAKIATLPSLESLRLINTSIDISWAEVALLAQLPKLSHLSLSGNNITVEQFGCLEIFAKKDSLYLGITSWGDELKEREEYTKLKALFEESGSHLS